MYQARKLRFAVFVASLSPIGAIAQVPDMLAAFDAGGRALGAGTSIYATGADTLSATYNPAALGYVNRGMFTYATRNLPRTSTRVSGSLDKLFLDSSEGSGDFGVGHVGVAMPLRTRGGGQRGAFTLSWTIAGWFHDTQFGTALDPGIESYTDFTRARTELVTLGYGSTTAGQSVSWGAGAVFATQSIRNFQQITFEDPKIPPQIADTDNTGFGIGGLLGVMIVPGGNSNITYGVSVRTPIDLKKGGSDLPLYSRIPGRAVAGIAAVRDGLRGGRDSLLFGAQVEHYFGGKSSERLDRDDQTVFGVGVEYQYARGGGVIPIRLGYRVVPAGGQDFANRHGVSFGVGYRPSNLNWSIELNLAWPAGGELDSSLAIGYRFGN